MGFSKFVKIALLCLEVLACEVICPPQRESANSAVRSRDSGVVEYLAWAKYHSDNRQYNDDYHIAYLTAKFAASRVSNPWSAAILKYYGITGERWTRERRELWARRERELEVCAEGPRQLSLDFNALNLPPKKPSVSVPGKFKEATA